MCEAKQQYRHPLDGLWSWLVLFTAWWANAVGMGFATSFGVLLPEIREYFNTSKQKVAWIASIALSLATLLGPVAGALVNRFGYRRVAILGAIMCIVSLTTTSFVEKMEFMYFSFGIIFGSGVCCHILIGFLVITQYFKKWKALATGVVSGGMGAGPLAYGPCLELLLSSVGWRWTFRIVAAVFLVTTFLFCVYEQNAVEQDNGKEKAEKNKTKKHERKLIDCSVWRNYRYVVFVLGGALAIFSKYIPIVHLAQFAQDQGISSQGSARLYLYMGLGTTVSRPASGLLCQMKRVNTTVVFQVSIFLSGIVYTLLPNLKTYEFLVMFSVLFGLIDGLFSTLQTIVFLNVFRCPKKTSSGFGIMMMCFSVARGAGPPIAGWMADVYESFNPAFYLAGASCFFATVLLFFLPFLKGEEKRIVLPNDSDVQNIEQLLLVSEKETVL